MGLESPEARALCQLVVCGRKRGLAKERVCGRECVGESVWERVFGRVCGRECCGPVCDFVQRLFFP